MGNGIVCRGVFGLDLAFSYLHMSSVWIFGTEATAWSSSLSERYVQASESTHSTPGGVSQGWSRDRENHLSQIWLDSSVVSGFFGCEQTLLDHPELLISQHSQVFLLRGALSIFSTQPIFVLGIALTQDTELCLCLQRPADSLPGPISREIWESISIHCTEFRKLFLADALRSDTKRKKLLSISCGKES